MFRCVIIAAFLFLAGSDSLRSEALKLNANSRTVYKPSGRLGYGTAQAGETLYLTWSGRGSKGSPQILLSRVNLAKWEIEETIQVTEGRGLGKGSRGAPVVSADGERVDIAWVEKRPSANQAHDYYLKVLSLEDFKSGRSEPATFKLGSSPQFPEFIKTQQGLFLAGHARDSTRGRWLLRLYRKTSGKWRAVTAINETEGTSPVLLGGGGRLSLYWLRFGDLMQAHSSDGNRWTSPVSLSQQGVLSLRGVRDSAGETHLAWTARHERLEAVVRVMSTRNGQFQKPSTVERIPTRDLQIEMGVDRQTRLPVVAYSYGDKKEKGQVVSSAGAADGWEPKRLSAGGYRVVASKWPEVFPVDGQVYVAWSQYDQTKWRETFAGRIYVSGQETRTGRWFDSPILIEGGGRGASLLAPELFEYDSQLFVSYYSSIRVKSTGGKKLAMTAAMTSPTRGNLYLRRVDVEGIAKQERQQPVP